MRNVLVLEPGRKESNAGQGRRVPHLSVNGLLDGCVDVRYQLIRVHVNV
jgi:hypothetical protein